MFVDVTTMFSILIFFMIRTLGRVLLMLARPPFSYAFFDLIVIYMFTMDAAFEEP